MQPACKLHIIILLYHATLAVKIAVLHAAISQRTDTEGANSGCKQCVRMAHDAPDEVQQRKLDAALECICSKIIMSILRCPLCIMSVDIRCVKVDSPIRCKRPRG